MILNFSTLFGLILTKVMCVGAKDFTLLGRPLLPHGMVRVEATVVEKSLSRTKIYQLFKKKEQFRRFRFNRDKWTLLRINDVDIKRLVD